MNPSVKSFFDGATSTWSHIVWDGIGRDALVIDPVLDYCPDSGVASTGSADQLAAFLREQQLEPLWIIETHAHADHISSAQYLKKLFNARVAIGAGIRSVQDTFKKVFNLPEEFATDGSQFDALLSDGEVLSVGQLRVLVMATPGHTSDSVSLRIGDSIFVGDTLFAPAYGTARCDFPGGDSSTLYRSIQSVLALPDHTRLYLCHDYPPPGQKPCAFVTVGEQREHNIHVGNGVSEQDFVKLRKSRDKDLPVPRLIFPSIQINIRAGALPRAEDNGVSYLKIPLTGV